MRVCMCLKKNVRVGEKFLSVGFDSGHALRKKHEFTSASNVIPPPTHTHTQKSNFQKYLKR